MYTRDVTNPHSVVVPSSKLFCVAKYGGTKNSANKFKKCRDNFLVIRLNLLLAFGK